MHVSYFNTYCFGPIQIICLYFRKHWPVRTWQDAVKMSVSLTMMYVSIYGPYVISVWNPLSYTYLIGPAAHTLVQISAMTVVLWYMKNKK